jgi:hypothetical protein
LPRIFCQNRFLDSDRRLQETFSHVNRAGSTWRSAWPRPKKPKQYSIGLSVDRSSVRNLGRPLVALRLSHNPGSRSSGFCLEQARQSMIRVSQLGRKKPAQDLSRFPGRSTALVLVDHGGHARPATKA